MTDDRVDSLLCPESYLRESFGSMLFRAQPLAYSGKLVRRRVCRPKSAPALNCSPPKQTQPFVQADLGPLPMSPPADTELGIIMCSRNREGGSGHFVAEDA